MKATEWKWYLPDDHETAEDARVLMVPDWRMVFDAEGAAVEAGEQSWDHGGYESGLNSTEVVCIIAPDGTETRWIIRHEATVEHYAEARHD